MRTIRVVFIALAVFGLLGCIKKEYGKADTNEAAVRHVFQRANWLDDKIHRFPCDTALISLLPRVYDGNALRTRREVAASRCAKHGPGIYQDGWSRQVGITTVDSDDNFDTYCVNAIDLTFLGDRSGTHSVARSNHRAFFVPFEENAIRVWKIVDDHNSLALQDRQLPSEVTFC